MYRLCFWCHVTQRNKDILLCFPLEALYLKLLNLDFGPVLDNLGV